MSTTFWQGTVSVITVTQLFGCIYLLQTGGVADRKWHITNNCIMSVVRDIERHRDSAGTYPTDLGPPTPMEVCGTHLDGWEKPLIYRLLTDGYELRSSGRDGEPDTDDDMIYNPAVRYARMRAVQGCYRVTTDWDDFPNALLVLDSVPIGRDFKYSAKPHVGHSYGSEWQPFSPDSVLVEWWDAEWYASMRLQRLGDSLVGVAFHPTLFRGRKKQVVAVKVACVGR